MGFLFGASIEGLIWVFCSGFERRFDMGFLFRASNEVFVQVSNEGFFRFRTKVFVQVSNEGFFFRFRTRFWFRFRTKVFLGFERGFDNVMGTAVLMFADSVNVCESVSGTVEKNPNMKISCPRKMHFFTTV
jgi:hypothetical protein